MSVRVVRIMEYTYPDGESAAADMERWAVQRTVIHGKTKIRSNTLPPDFFYVEDDES